MPIPVVLVAALAAGAVLFIVVFPLLNAAGVVSNFTINLWGKYLCFAMLAISVDLLWGYTGLLSLGQSLFFALSKSWERFFSVSPINFETTIERSIRNTSLPVFLPTIRAVRVFPVPGGPWNSAL